MATAKIVHKDIEVKKIEKVEEVQLTLSRSEAQFLVSMLGGLTASGYADGCGCDYASSIYDAIERTGIKSAMCYTATLKKVS